MHPYRNLLAATCLALGLATLAAGPQDKPARRLDSITWNPVEHTLSWTVSSGKVDGQGKFAEVEKLRYQIDMDAATMNFKGEDRGFSRSEARSVHQLMDLVSKYAAESTLWWDAGQGEPVDKDQRKIDRDHPENRSPRVLPQRPRRGEAPTVIRLSTPPQITRIPTSSY